MDKVSVEIPHELYQLLEEDAGTVPVEHYVTWLISTARRHRPKEIVVEDVDAFIREVQPWEQMLGKATFHGSGGGGSMDVLPSGRVEVTAGGYFLAIGQRVSARISVGQLSERFVKDGQVNIDLFGKAYQSRVPWEVAAPEEPPLDDNDQAVFAKLKEVGIQMLGVLEHLGVPLSDTLRRAEDEPAQR